MFGEYSIPIAEVSLYYFGASTRVLDSRTTSSLVSRALLTQPLPLHPPYLPPDERNNKSLTDSAHSATKLIQEHISRKASGPIAAKLPKTQACHRSPLRISAHTSYENAAVLPASVNAGHLRARGKGVDSDTRRSTTNAWETDFRF